MSSAWILPAIAEKSSNRYEWPSLPPAYSWVCATAGAWNFSWNCGLCPALCSLIAARPPPLYSHSAKPTPNSPEGTAMKNPNNRKSKQTLSKIRVFTKVPRNVQFFCDCWTRARRARWCGRRVNFPACFLPASLWVCWWVWVIGSWEVCSKICHSLYYDLRGNCNF